eukprot:8503172-Pyramimonas_sp.AAC.1
MSSTNNCRLPIDQHLAPWQGTQWARECPGRTIRRGRRGRHIGWGYGVLCTHLIRGVEAELFREGGEDGVQP